MKKQFKKHVALLMTASMAAVTLMGCGSAGKTDATTQAAQSAAETTTAGGSGESVTLRFSWWGSDSRHGALLDVIDAYQAKNPNVKIEAEYQGYDGYYEKIMTTLSSNTAPDIIQLKNGCLIFREQSIT